MSARPPSRIGVETSDRGLYDEIARTADAEGIVPIEMFGRKWCVTDGGWSGFERRGAVMLTELVEVVHG